MDNKIDAALLLRQKNDKGIITSEDSHLLTQSPLINKLTAQFVPKTLFAVWRIGALSEIPLTTTLDYTHTLIHFIEQYMVTPEGFSLTGNTTDIIPCYNAMILEAYCKLGIVHTHSAKAALSWIKTYQPFERGKTSLWQGKGVIKYGGCLRLTPCYIGVAKSVKALAYYNKATDYQDTEAVSLANKGMEYLLQHHLYQRLRDGQPFNSHALDIAFPASYQLNILELIEIAYLMQRLNDPRCQHAINVIKIQQQTDQSWKNSHVYKADGYISFDGKKKTSPWATYLLNKYLAFYLQTGN